jgi:hypothetical protein
MSGSSEIAPPPPVFPVTPFTPTPKAARRALEFFTAQIHHDHAHQAYMDATRLAAAAAGGKRCAT